MYSRIVPVMTSTSTAGTRPPWIEGMRRSETMPFSVAPSMSRTCCCWCGGKKSMIRLIVSVASMVCSVEKTRLPISAAVSAAETVSKSRISPMRMTSGSWRTTWRSASE